MELIIFTDLDGTLLDAGTYSFQKALNALEVIRKKEIPLVFVSSKTRAEIEFWRQKLGNSHPFVVENGGGIFIPEGYFSSTPPEGTHRDGYHVISLGMDYPEIRKRFIRLRDRLSIPVRGFGDMSAGEVASLTGLTEEQAVLAKKRDYCEPFIFSGRHDDRFLREIEAEKLRWTQGHFFHIMGNHHKGKAVMILRSLYESDRGAVRTAGIGDSLNDLPFLLAVDSPVLVRKAGGIHDARVDIPGLMRTQGIGPAGWNEAVLQLMSESVTHS